jgi:hypothetical protein
VSGRNSRRQPEPDRHPHLRPMPPAPAPTLPPSFAMLR